jgi:AcrR family transcriptional regulator
MPYHRTERSEKRRQATRGRILRVARKLFAKKGFAATTVQEIVRAANTSVGNFYFYFENKSDLLRILLEGALTASWARGDEILKRTRPGPRNLAVMAYSTAIGLLVHDRDLTRLIAGNETHAPVQLRLVELNTPRVRTRIRESFPHLADDQLDLAVAAWSGSARYCVRLGASDETGLTPPMVAAFIARWNLRGIGVLDDEIDDAIAYANQAFAAVAEGRDAEQARTG